MAHRAHDPRLVAVPAEHRAYVADIVQRRGTTEAARILRIGRTGILGIIARGQCMPGTAALLREAYSHREAA